MLLNAVKVNEDVLSAVVDYLSRSLGKGEEDLLKAVLPETLDLQIVQRVVEKLGEEARRAINLGLVEKVISQIVKVFYLIQELPDIEEAYDIVVSAVDLLSLDTDVVEAASRHQDRRIQQAATKTDLRKLAEISKKISETIVTSRDLVKVFQEFSAGRFFKEKVAILASYAVHRVLKGTRFELGNVLALPAHVDIHLLKVLLRTGILQIDPEVLEKYAGAGKYKVKIVPVCAKLAPDEPFKTLWDVLRRHALTALKLIAEKFECPQIIFASYFSAIGRRVCIFNDDSLAGKHLCPVKELRQCPLAVVCRTYAGLQNLKIFSRRQARLLLRYFGVSSRKAEEVECELIVI